MMMPFCSLAEPDNLRGCGPQTMRYGYRVSTVVSFPIAAIVQHRMVVNFTNSGAVFFAGMTNDHDGTPECVVYYIITLLLRYYTTTRTDGYCSISPIFCY